MSYTLLNKMFSKEVLNMQRTTYNSLPCRTAMTRPTHCHAGQQQQPCLAQAARNRRRQVLPTIRSCRPGFYLAGIHQMAPPKWGGTHLIIALLLIYRPRKDERLSWPSWLTCSGRFTHVSGHPSTASQAQDRESLSPKYRRSTAVIRHQATLDISQGSVATHLRCGGSLLIVL